MLPRIQGNQESLPLPQGQGTVLPKLGLFALVQLAVVAMAGISKAFQEKPTTLSLVPSNLPTAPQNLPPLLPQVHIRDSQLMDQCSIFEKCDMFDLPCLRSRVKDICRNEGDNCDLVKKSDWIFKQFENPIKEADKQGQALTFNPIHWSTRELRFYAEAINCLFDGACPTIEKVSEMEEIFEKMSWCSSKAGRGHNRCHYREVQMDCFFDKTSKTCRDSLPKFLEKSAADHEDIWDRYIPHMRFACSDLGYGRNSEGCEALYEAAFEDRRKFRQGHIDSYSKELNKNYKDKANLIQQIQDYKKLDKMTKVKELENRLEIIENKIKENERIKKGMEDNLSEYRKELNAILDEPFDTFKGHMDTDLEMARIKAGL